MFTNHILPFDVAVLILTYVRDDLTAFINLSSTCRLFLEAANYLAKSPYWIHKFSEATLKSLSTYNLYKGRSLTYYSPFYKYLKGHILWVLEYPCPVVLEMALNPKAKLVPNATKSPSLVYWNDVDNCRNFNCLLQAKHRIFSHLSLRTDHVGEFYEAFIKAIEVNRSLAETRLSFIVDLEFLNCYIDSISLGKLLKELPNISYLTIAFSYLSYDNAREHLLEPKVLKKLTLYGCSRKLNDSKFIFFLKYFPAEELELACEDIVEPEGTRKVYPSWKGDIYNSSVMLDKPSDIFLTFPVVFKYLRSHSVKRFKVYGSCKGWLHLLLEDPNLQQLRITRVERFNEANFRKYLNYLSLDKNAIQLSQITIVPLSMYYRPTWLDY